MKDISLLAVTIVLLWTAAAVWAQAKPAASALRIAVGKRFVRPAEGFSFDVSLTAGAKDEKARALRRLTVRFPGFEGSGEPVLTDDGAARVTGRIGRPGFFPFEVACRLKGAAHSKRDYVVVTPKSAKDTGAFDHHGYYVFLGRKGRLRSNRLGAWGLAEWKKLTDWMSAHGADRLWVMVNCYWLAYPSRKYPTLVDKGCANVKTGLLTKLIDYAHGKGIKVYLSYTSDDYAEGFAARHPETLCAGRDGKTRGRSGLCLENEKVQRYLVDTVAETFALYPAADGIFVHPNESSYVRYNAETQARFKADTGKDMLKASWRAVAGWYARRAAEITRDMFAAARAVNPKADCIMFHCPWFDGRPDLFLETLPADSRVCVWHYLHHGTALKNRKLFRWVKKFGPDRLIFMPNGFNYGYPRGRDARIERHIGNDRLLSVAAALGYRESVYYVHWTLEPAEDRLRDLVMAKYPTASFLPPERAADAKAIMEFTRAMYADYFKARREALAPAE